MASFTDINVLPSLTNFKPYVEQIPVDAYVNVGRIKQSQYDQGIQKIQSQIDNIAGLDVIKDVDKQYLQSKLNELGGNLRHVAAGDFSNYQLTNSVGGMITKIGKDPNIQSAVKSTQIVKKGQQDMEAARKAGKSSPENEWWWNNQVASWLDDKKVGSSFNGRFIEYKDVDTKLRGIAEKLHEIDNSIDVPYQRDAQGNVLRDRSGRPLVDDAMLRIKTKGKPAEKILANFYDSLDENDKLQLAITGNYHYRNASKDTFKSEIRNNYSNLRTMLTDSLVNFNLELQSNPKLTTPQRAEIQAKINDINAKLNGGVLESELNAELSNIDAIPNLQDYKARLYTQRYLTNLAKDVSYQSYQQEIVNNPYAQMAMERSNLQFRYDEAARNQRNWEAEFGLKQADLALKQAELVRKSREATGDTKPATPGRLSTDVSVPTLMDLSKEISSIKGDPSTGTVGEIDVLDNEYAPLVTDPTLSTPTQKKEYLDRLAERYSMDPSTIASIKDPNMREYLERRRSLEILAAQKQVLYNSTVEASKFYDNQIQAILTNEPGYTDEGRQIYSARELYDVNKDLTRTFTKFFPSAGTGAPSTSSVDTKGFLDKYAGTKYEPLAIALVKKNRGEPLSSIAERAMTNRSQEIVSKFNSKVSDVSEKKVKFQSEYLAQRMPERQSSIFTLDVNNSKTDDRIDERSVEQLLGAKFIEAEQLGSVDTNKVGEFDPEIVAEFKADKEAVYTIEKRYDGTANLVISSKGKQQVVPMTASEFSTFFPGYARVNPVDNIKYAVLGSPNKTTNLSGRKDDAVNAYLTGYHLPQLAGTALAPLVRVDVEGSPSNRGDANDKYVVRMYVNNNGVWKSDILTQAGYVNDAQLQAVLQNIGTKTVDDLLKKNK